MNIEGRSPDWAGSLDATYSGRSFQQAANRWDTIYWGMGRAQNQGHQLRQPGTNPPRRSSLP